MAFREHPSAITIGSLQANTCPMLLKPPGLDMEGTLDLYFRLDLQFHAIRASRICANGMEVLCKIDIPYMVVQGFQASTVFQGGL